MATEEYISIQKVCEILKINLLQLKQLILEGKLKASMPQDGEMMFLKQEVVAYQYSNMKVTDKPKEKNGEPHITIEVEPIEEEPIMTIENADPQPQSTAEPSHPMKSQTTSTPQQLPIHATSSMRPTSMKALNPNSQRPHQPTTHLIIASQEPAPSSHSSTMQRIPQQKSQTNSAPQPPQKSQPQNNSASEPQQEVAILHEEIQTILQEYQKSCQRYKEFNQNMMIISTFLGSISANILLMPLQSQNERIQDFLLSLLGIICFAFFMSLLICAYSNVLLNRVLDGIVSIQNHKSFLWVLGKYYTAVFCKNLSQISCVIGIIGMLLYISCRLFMLNFSAGVNTLCYIFVFGVLGILFFRTWLGKNMAGAEIAWNIATKQKEEEKTVSTNSKLD